MRDSDKLFAGSIPALYDRLLAPLIFQSYAEDLAARAALDAPVSVLEIAAGTGVLPRALAPLLVPDCRYTITDLNAPMLDFARGRQPEDRRIDWRVADALALPFPDRGFDRILCQFGVMFFPDRVAGYREALRALRPGGRFLFNCWDRIETNEFADLVTRALATLFPDDPPRFLARVPHGYHDPDRIRADLAAAGFGAVTVAPLEALGTARDVGEVATAFCQGTPLRAEIEARGAAPEAVTLRVTEALGETLGTGPVTGRARAFVVTAETA